MLIMRIDIHLESVFQSIIQKHVKYADTDFYLRNKKLPLESSNVFYPLIQNKKGGKYCRKIPAS